MFRVTKVKLKYKRIRLKRSYWNDLAEKLTFATVSQILNAFLFT